MQKVITDGVADFLRTNCRIEVCFEGIKNEKEIYRYCQSKFTMVDLLLNEVVKTGKYCNETITINATKCYCNTATTN